MADQPNAAATTPLAPTVVQPPGAGGPAQPAGGFSVPDGKMLVDTTEYQRHQEQLRGSKSFVEAARRHGFDKPEAFEKYGKFTGTLKQRGLTLDQLMQAFDGSPEAGADAAQAQGFSPAQIDQYLKQNGYVTASELDKRETFNNAHFEHKTQAQQEEALYKAQLAEFLGKDTPEDEREFWEALAEKQAWDIRSKPETFYPKEHPLAEKYPIRPLKEQEIKSVFAELAKKRELRKGAKLAALGQTPSRGVSTPAGSSASSPSTLPKSPSKDMRPGGKPSVADIEAAHERIKARRGGGPVSSLGS